MKFRLFNSARSASASPGAYEKYRALKNFKKKGIRAHCVREESKFVNKFLEWQCKPMRFLCLDVDSPLQLWPIEAVKDKDRNYGQGQEPTETIKENPKCWIFASSGASSRPKIDRRLCFIHPDTDWIEQNI
jgi:hypothetical protein